MLALSTLKQVMEEKVRSLQLVEACISCGVCGSLRVHCKHAEAGRGGEGAELPHCFLVVLFAGGAVFSLVGVGVFLLGWWWKGAVGWRLQALCQPVDAVCARAPTPHCAVLFLCG